MFGSIAGGSPVTAVPPSSPIPTTIAAPPSSSELALGAGGRGSGSGSPKLAGDFEIDIGLVQAGIDMRTTCMIRNIPNKYTQVSPARPRR